MEPDKNKDFKPGEEKSHVSGSGSNEITENDESATEAAPAVNEDGAANQVPDNNGDSSNISDSNDTSAAIRTPDPLESNDPVNQGDSDKIDDLMKSSGSDDSGKSGESDKNSSADEASDNSSSGSHKTKKSNRCQVCRKKVGLTGFVCRCGGLFCSVHRYSDKHNCTFNYRELGAEEIRKNNPVILSEKIHKI